MKKLFTIIIFLISNNYLFPFAGVITKDTTWASDVIVTGNVIILEGITLTIMPGVNVRFPFLDQNNDGIGDIKFIIKGRLLSQGTQNLKVSFKSNQPTPGMKDWAGIFYETPQSGMLTTLSYTEISNAYQGFTLNGRNVTFSNVRIYNCFDYGIYIQSTMLTTTFVNTTIEKNNGYGIQINQGTVTISGLIIYKNNKYGLKINKLVNLTATNVISSSNEEQGIYIDSTGSASFTDCRSVSNKNHGVYINSSSPSFTNCDISNNRETGAFIIGPNSNTNFLRCNINSNWINGFYFLNVSNSTITYSNILHNKKEGIVLNNSTPTFNDNNIFNNGFDSKGPDSEIINIQPDTAVSSLRIPILIRSVLYKKDGGNTTVPANSCYINRTLLNFLINSDNVINQEHEYKYCNTSGMTQSHDMPLTIVEHNVTNKIFILKSISYSLQIVYTLYCNYPSAWGVSFKYSRYSFAKYLIGFNLTTIANFQNNWWGQINFVDTLIYQELANTINYSNYRTQYIQNAGCNLPNISPQISINAPAVTLPNPTSVLINYDASDLDDNANIKFYYKRTLSEPGTLITELQEDGNPGTFTWNLTGIPDGTYYIVGIINDGVNPPDTAIAGGRIIVGGLTIYTPMNNSGVAGSSIKIPIKTINSIDYYNIISFQFTISFNPALLTATGISTDSTLTSEWSLYFNNNTPGQITVNGFSATPLNSEGTLVNIKFDVSPGAANYANCPINFADVVINNGNPTPTIKNGKFTVINKYNISGKIKYYALPNKNIPSVRIELKDTLKTYNLYTDTLGNFLFPPVDAGNYTLTPIFKQKAPDLVITPYDAALTAQFAIGTYQFTTNQQKAADLNNDNQATVYDAALIAQYSVGLIDTFTAGYWKFDPPNKFYSLINNFENQIFLGICIGDPSGNWSPSTTLQKNLVQKVEVPKNFTGFINLPIKTNKKFCSIYTRLKYDTTKIRLKDIVYSSEIGEMTKLWTNKNGVISFAAYSTSKIQSNDELVNFIFETKSNINNERDDILNIEFLLFDEQEEIITFIKTDDINNLPKSYQLLQNYPNPFNPTTTISFDVPANRFIKGKEESVSVTLKIFDVLGRVVETLVDGPQTAGRYSIIWDASKYSTGIYYYELKAGEYRDIKKMLFVK